MTAKFKQIVDKLNALVTFKDGNSMTDDDFIANVDAINLLYNLYDDLNLDRSDICRKMGDLYPEFARRIYGKENIQHAMPLIKALDSFIYGRGDDRGPARWREDLAEICCQVVNAYRKEPIIGSTDYLFALDMVSGFDEESSSSDIKEYKEAIEGYMDDIDKVCLAEKIKRVRAYQRSKHLFASDAKEKWSEVYESLKTADISQLDDRTFILWRKITDIAPMKELKKRAEHSKQMQVEYLQGLIFTEFERVHRAAVKKKLARDLKMLNDEFISDIIPLNIDSDMSVSSLHALEAIFHSRLQLAQVDWDDKEPVYNSLCRNRFEKLAKALKKKYKTAESLNEKIEILERLVSIGMTINSGHFSFALEEAESLKDLPNLTYAQKLRLDWIPDIDPENESQIVAALLPQATSSFDLATVALISDFLTAEERESVLNRYFDLLDTALSTDNVAELGKLLALAAYWNSDPTIRPRLTAATRKVQSVDGLTLPERRVNPIAAEIYTRIDNITGKYEGVA